VVTSAHPVDDVRVASRITTAILKAGYRVTWVGPNITLSAHRDVRLPDVDYRLFETGRGRAGRLRAAGRAVRLARDIQDVDWWYSPDPDMAAKLPGLARGNGGATLFDVHESYHGGLLERWFPGGRPPTIVRELMRRRVAAICRRVDLVIGVSDRVLEPYCRRQPNHVVVRNLAPSWFAPDRPEAGGAQDQRMRFMHGKVSAGNGTLQVAAAFSELSPETQAGAQVVMLDVESTPSDTRAHVTGVGSRLAEDTISVIPGVPHEQMAELMATCSVGLISYQRDLGHESLPNRLFEYMAAGLAVIAPSYSPEIVKILETENIGLTADFEVPSDIARAIEWCLHNPIRVAEMGARARAAYLNRYTWQSEADMFLERLRAYE
jgi:glycosyltransferase involved in cell wall biosynthesis